MELKDVRTKELVDELAKREGVERYNLWGELGVRVANGCGDTILESDGPAIVLYITD